MFSLIPLLVIPFVLFNAALAGLIGSGAPDPVGGSVLSFGMMSGGRFDMSFGDVLLALGLVLLFFEVLKSTRTNSTSVIDHVLSTGVFVAYLVQFLLVAGAAHPVFFLLMLMALIDVLAGFSVSIRAAGRDISLN
jgi:steroid 5-alpha reductase family enzyme